MEAVPGRKHFSRAKDRKARPAEGQQPCQAATQQWDAISAEEAALHATTAMRRAHNQELIVRAD